MNISENLDDHIDAPIKKAVAGLALLGLNPIMSCCGFPYDNEEVPKTHLKKAYVYLSWSDQSKIPYELFCACLLTISKVSGWSISPARVSFGGLMVFDFFGDTWSSGHPWENKDAVHNYEIFVLAINALNKTLEKYESQMFDSAVLEDGNKIYAEITSYWKYKPTKPWTITKEIWKSLPI